MARKKVGSSEGAVENDNSVLTDILVDSLNKKLGDVAYIMGKGESFWHWRARILLYQR